MNQTEICIVMGVLGAAAISIVMISQAMLIIATAFRRIADEMTNLRLAKERANNARGLR